MNNKKIIVIGNNAKHWLMTLPCETKSLQEAINLACLRGSQLYGKNNKFYMYGHWRLTGPVLCIAIPQSILDIFVKSESMANISIYTSLDCVLSLPKTTLPYVGWCVISFPGQVIVISMKNGIWVTLRTLVVSLKFTDKLGLLDLACAELNRESMRISGLNTSNESAPLEHQVLWYDWTTVDDPDRSEFNHAGWHFTWKNGWCLSITDKNKLDRLAAQMEEATNTQALDACVAAALGQIGR